MDLEEEEFERIEDIHAEGVESMTRLPEYNPLRKGKANITKDLDMGKFSVLTLFLLEQVFF